jgi:hypothetical protein
MPRSQYRGADLLSASGAASTGAGDPLGPVTFTGTLEYKTAIQDGATVGYRLQNGTATLTTAAGDKLDLRFTGEYYESGTTYGLAWNGTIEGGTGQYKDATGTFTAWGTYDVTTGALQVPSITLSLGHK